MGVSVLLSWSLYYSPGLCTTLLVSLLVSVLLSWSLYYSLGLSPGLCTTLLVSVLLSWSLSWSLYYSPGLSPGLCTTLLVSLLVSVLLSWSLYYSPGLCTTLLVSALPVKPMSASCHLVFDSAVYSSSLLLYVHRDYFFFYALLGTGSPGRPPELSYSS